MVRAWAVGCNTREGAQKICYGMIKLKLFRRRRGTEMEWDPTAWTWGNFTIALVVGFFYWKLMEIEKNTRK